MKKFFTGVAMTAASFALLAFGPSSFAAPFIGAPHAEAASCPPGEILVEICHGEVSPSTCFPTCVPDST